MADNYLITGYWGEPHVTVEEDRGINAGIFGKGKWVLPVGEQFRAAYIGNNTIRMYDGKLVDNGAAAGIPAGRYIDFTISEAGQGKSRNDIIMFQYTKDMTTLIESGRFGITKGTEVTGFEAGVDPELHHEDLLSDEATFDQMGLWRVCVSGNDIYDLVPLFNVFAPNDKAQHGVVTTGTGSAYEAKVEGIQELAVGESFIMVPHTVSTVATPTLDVNGLGQKMIRRRITGNSSLTTPSTNEGWLSANKPVTVVFNGTYWVIDAKPNANDLYGEVPIDHGGTGADNAEEARENLGAAPSGFGLGVEAVLASDCNTTLKNGWYYASSTTTNKPGSLNNCTFFVLARNSSQVYQYFFNQSNGCVMQRYTTNGGSTWTEEWINPPMALDTEYRTTERFNGMPVYCKTVSISFERQMTTEIMHNIANITNIVRLIGTLTDGTTLPYYKGSDRCFVMATKTHIIVDVNFNVSATSGYATIYYTK